MRKIKRLPVILLGLFVVSSACTKKAAHSGLPPEEVVKLFVQMSTQVKAQDDRQKLASLCGEEMRRAFNEMNEETFELAYINNPLELKSFEVLQNNTLNQIANVHYKVTVSNPGGTDPTTETTERRVNLKKEGDAWYLTSIRPEGTDTVHFTRGMIF